MYCFVQARMSSKRLPGKTMRMVNGKPLISYVLKRLKKSKLISRIIVLTSTNKPDDRIVNFCKKNKVLYFRSELKNVYKRFFKAINFYKNKSFVRITADSPNIDPDLVDRLILKFKKKNYDIVTNCKDKTFPKGQSIEIVNSKSFLKLKSFLNRKNYLEHITTFFYKNEKNFFIYCFKNKKKYRNKNLSVDNMNDLKRFKKFLSRHTSIPLNWKKIYNSY
jgi:spore coat polysaccharide biosynthesis protein SpsF|tara:strand:+ start:1759 stop:2418 length:660 start_codon:yes stop_codon:yes gene_type:complete